MTRLVEPVGPELGIANGGFFPDSVKLASGNYVVSRLDMIGGNDTQIQLYDPSGNALGAPYSIAVAVSYHSLAALASGGFVVVFGTNFDARFQIFDATGSPVGAAQLLGPTDYSTFSLHAMGLAGGGFIASWTNSGVTTVRMFDGAGTSVATLAPQIPADGGGQRVIELANGTLAVVWHEYDSVTPPSPYADGYEVAAQLFSANGTALSGKFIVNQSQAGSHAEPEVTALAGGGFVVTWVTNGANAGIKAQVYDANGAPVGSNFLVSDLVAGYQSQPDVAALPWGGFLVSWTDSSSGNPQNFSSGIRAQLFDGTGARMGETIQVNNQLFASEVTPSVLIMSSTEAKIFYHADGNANPSGIVERKITLPVVGTQSGDTMTGTPGIDRLAGLGGDDTINGLASDDAIDGGGGNDTLDGGTGDDTIDGGAGFDILRGGGGVNILRGGNDSDVIEVDGSDSGSVIDGGGGLDTLSLSGSFTMGGASSSIETVVFYTATLNVTSAQLPTALAPNARLLGTGGIVVTVQPGISVNGAGLMVPAGSVITFTVNGSGSNDTITGVNGISNFLYGADGADTINGGTGDDTLDGGAGVNLLDGGGGNDRLILGASGSGSSVSGGAGNDTLAVGGAVSLGALSGIEIIELGGAALTLTATQFTNGLAVNGQITGTGSVTITVDQPNQILFATSVAVAAGIGFTITGSSGSDLVKAAHTTNTIDGGAGSDFLRGGNLSDTINGGADRDKIIGWGGADTLTGGGGNDQFRYLLATDSGLGAAADAITDFVSGTDQLDFRFLDSDLVTPDVQPYALSFIGTGAFSGTGSSQIRYGVTGADLTVELDLDGNGTADMQIVLQGNGGSTLGGGDFLL